MTMSEAVKILGSNRARYEVQNMALALLYNRPRLAPVRDSLKGTRTMTTNNHDQDAALSALTDEYEAWLALPQNANVPKISADEACCEIEGDMHPRTRSPALQAQIEWLTDFIDRWEEACK